MSDNLSPSDDKTRTRKKLKKIINIFKNRESNLTNLLMRFILVVILIVMFLLALDIYLYNYQPIVLSKFQYSYYKNNVNLPPGLPNSSGEGKNYLLAEQLEKCPAGFCAISKTTGLKRCPDGNYQLIYNSSEEVCTRAEFCDYSDLPYAVLTDGTTSLSGKCNSGVPCRCTDQKSCDTGIVSPFETILGTNFDPNQNNFTITQIPETGNEYGYDSIVLPTPSSQVCVLNTGFTDRLVNGCDFTNSVRDKLDCQDIASLVPVSSNPGISGNVGKLINNVYIGNTSFQSKEFVPDTSSQYLLTTLPDSGYLEFSDFDRSRTELIYYNQKSITSKVITVSGIVHLESTPESVPYGTLGFGLSWTTPGTCTIINSYEAVTKFCQSATDGPNFKNMLLCVQEPRQPCLQGTLSYNFNKLNSGNTTTSEVYTSEAFSRNFCQQRSNTSELELRSNYLEDPAFYTVGCYLGNGCNNKELSLNGETGLKAASGKYFPDVDVSGINGVWKITNIGYPSYKPTANQSSSFIYKSLEPGDFWSIQSEGETLITNKVSTGGTSTIFVSSLLSLDSYIGSGEINSNVRPLINLSVGASPQLSFNVISCNFNNANGQFSMNVDSNLLYNIPSNTGIKVNPINFDGSDFVYYGIITEHTSINSNNNPIKHYQFSDINGNTPSDTIQEDIFNIVVFKQFSFSGGNYNTIVYNDSGIKRRVYSGSRDKPIFAKTSATTTTTSAIIPPQNISNVFLNQANISYNSNLVSPISSFQGSQEPFKIPLSMYYPVWNPVTFQQECVRCKPNLTSYIELGTNENIDTIPIQYSGKDFDNYEFEPQSGGFVFTSASEIDTSLFNTTKTFNLKEPNPNLQVGDFIMSLNLQFPVNIVGGTSVSNYQTGLGTSLTIIPQITYGSSTGSVLSSTRTKYGIEESINSNFVIPKGVESTPGGGTEIIVEDNRNLNIEINPSGNGYLIKDLETSKPDGYCFGKLYRTSKTSSNLLSLTDNEFGFYLLPNVSIIDISLDGKTITTNASLAKDLIVDNSLPFSKYLQFCRIGKNLLLDLRQDLGSDRNVIGQNELIKIDKISGGRITNINVIDGGTNFLENTVPIVTLNNYDYYVS